MKTHQISGTKFFLVNRKPTICPQCGERKVRKAILDYPNKDDYYNDKIYCIGCIPDFPVCRDWGCNNCDAAFIKETIEVIKSLEESILEQK